LQAPPYIPDDIRRPVSPYNHVLPSNSPAVGYDGYGSNHAEAGLRGTLQGEHGSLVPESQMREPEVPEVSLDRGTLTPIDRAALLEEGVERSEYLPHIEELIERKQRGRTAPPKRPGSRHGASIQLFPQRGNSATQRFDELPVQRKVKVRTRPASRMGKSARGWIRSAASSRSTPDFRSVSQLGRHPGKAPEREAATEAMAKGIVRMADRHARNGLLTVSAAPTPPAHAPHALARAAR